MIEAAVLALFILEMLTLAAALWRLQNEVAPMTCMTRGEAGEPNRDGSRHVQQLIASDVY